MAITMSGSDRLQGTESANVVDASLPGQAVKVLSLSCSYPNAADPCQGVFIQRRLQHLAELIEVQVMAPVAFVQYGKPKGQRVQLDNRYCPPVEADGRLAVRRPRWFYPPFSGSLTSVWLFLALLYPLSRLRRKFSFQVIDAHFGHPNGVAAALLARALDVPFTITLRGNEPRQSTGWLSGRLMRFALREASAVFTVSERLRQFAIRLGADAAKVKTIPNGVDTGVFFARDRVTFRQKYGMPDGPVILSAGALIERKGHHRILQALKAISTTANRPQLFIAGGPGPEGQYEQKLRQLVADLDLAAAVRFLGVLKPEQMAEAMSAADVLCLASSDEGWPNVVHEALACGTPVVATDVGAVPEMLGGECHGLVVPVNDPAALEKALAAALGTTWDRAAISRWGQARSWHQVAREVMAELQAIANADSKKRVHK